LKEGVIAIGVKEIKEVEEIGITVELDYITNSQGALKNVLYNH
jgi:hypothetical protein